MIVGCGWLLRRGAAGRGARRLSVEERMSVGRGTQLMIVEVDSRRLLVGVCEKSINLVTELGSEEELAKDESTEPSGSSSRGPIDFARRGSIVRVEFI